MHCLCILKSNKRSRDYLSVYVFTHHVALMHLWVHGELHHKPGGMSQDKCCNQVPVDDISQTPDTPENGGEGKMEGKKDLLFLSRLFVVFHRV